MNWLDQPIPNDDEGRPMFKGSMDLHDDKNMKLASIIWFYDGGPYYAFAVDHQDHTVICRIGPVMTLDGAKDACVRAISGELDLTGRARYPNE